MGYVDTVLSQAEQHISGLIDQRLTREAFSSLCGRLAGVPFVKIVVVRDSDSIHFLNAHRYQFHSDYIAEQILSMSADELDHNLDDFNDEVYHREDRRFLLGTLGLHRQKDKRNFYTLETVETDTMSRGLIEQFYNIVRKWVGRRTRLYFKPNNHAQEADCENVPTITASALFSQSEYLCLNPGQAEGRLRYFKDLVTFQQQRDSLEWHDIIVMERVPEDIPRLSGIINAGHTTPLSHTNVLASGWQIPNAVQLGIVSQIQSKGLMDEWVRYTVDHNADTISLEPISVPDAQERQKPSWAVHQVRMEAPDAESAHIVDLSELRFADRFRYGTKAANLGELIYLLENGSPRLLGYYQLPRPPRENLLPHLAEFLGVDNDPKVLRVAAREFLRGLVTIPKGIALPFRLQREFLESSPQIQQTIGKLKMALQLGAREIDSLCVSLQNLIRKTRIPDPLRESIDEVVTDHLLGVSSFVVRSSSNAEDLEDFSAAGVYESINHVTTVDNLFNSIKEVWASLLSPRSTRLRQDVGISLDDSYMGVIIQEEVPSRLGGVMVTVNPTNRSDFRNVYLNCSETSVENIVAGAELPIQYLFNTVEGGGRTLSLGDATADLGPDRLDLLGRFCFAGRLLQSHFSPDYTFSWPVDIEWLADDDGISVLQLRPYAR